MELLLNRDRYTAGNVLLPMGIVITVSILSVTGMQFYSLLLPLGFIIGAAVVALVFKYPVLGLYLLIFNLPLNQYIPLFGLGGDNFSVSVNEILMVLLLLSVVIQRLTSGAMTFSKSRLGRPILLLIVFNGISLIVAAMDLSFTDYLKCWLRFFLWAEYFLIYFLIVDLIRTKQQVKIIYSLLIISGVVTVVSALYQQFSGNQLRSIGIVTSGGKTFYRLISGFGFYSNDFGAYLLILLSILVNVYFSRRRMSKVFYLMLILPTLYTLFFTFSRGSFIGLMALFVFLSLVRKEDRKQMAFMAATVTLVSVFVFTPVFLRWSQRTLVKKGGALVLQKNLSERLAQWEAAIDQFLESPVIGKGYNTFRYRVVNYESRFGRVRYIQHAHNIYLKLLMESGVLGFSSFLWFILIVYSSAKKILERSCSEDLRLTVLITLSALTAFLVTSLTDSLLGVGRVTGPLLVLIGLMMVKYRIEFLEKWRYELS